MRPFKTFMVLLLVAVDVPSLVRGEDTCSNGLAGVQTGDICCDAACGTCGGSGCSSRNGLTGNDCCVGNIKTNGITCSTSGEAPCIVDGEIEEKSTCSNGLAGVQNSNICCDAACGTCGGSGCSSRNGLTSNDCCGGKIKDSEVMCSTSGEAPCIVDDEIEEESTCSNGLAGVQNGNICCDVACGTCGGSGCSSRNGLTGNDCCGGTIKDSEVMCSTSGEAPCIVDDIAPTSPATPTPVSPQPTEFPATMATPAPTPVMTIPTSCTDIISPMRWASGTGLAGRLYLEDGGCATMTDLYQSRVESDGWTSKGPIYVLDENNDIVTTPTEFTGKWLLASELHILRGSIFYCRGRDIGGDCDELRIQSTGPTDFHEVRGHGGSLYFENTIVTSWDTPNKEPQETYEGGRSFLNCVSEYESDETCIGQPKNDYGECRMDIINSEMGYMGYFDSESYGLTWKVRGFCADKTNLEVFDTTNVYGDIKNSDIHHMYYGMYSYGHQGGVWTNNKMHDNHQYGFDPHDDSDYLTIANNEVYNNVNHGIIASKRCNHVDIYNNEVYDGGAQAAGIFLHRSSDSCKVYGNYVHDMQDAGMAMLESFDADIYDNRFENTKYGIRISLGGSNNYVHDNVFDNCSQYGLYTYKGSDAPEVYADGRPGENYFYDNEILNTATGVKLKRADNIEVIGNTFTGTTLLEFNHAFGTVWSDNTIPSDTCYKNIQGTDDEGGDIPASTFAATSTLPGLC